MRDFRCHHCNTWQKVANPHQELGKQEDIDYTKPWDHSDITFIVQGKKVYANKMVLSMASPVMKTMFESNFREKDAKEIKLPEKEFKHILNLMKIVHRPNQCIGKHFIFLPQVWCLEKCLEKCIGNCTNLRVFQ